MEIKEIKKLEKNLDKYFCEKCDFKCKQKCDWDRHILRPKHINNFNCKQMEIKKLEKTFICGCGKNFLTNAGLWKHNKKCIQINVEEENENTISPDMIIEIIKQNQEFKDLLIEQNKTIIELSKNSNTTNNTINNNCNNNLK